MAIRHLRMMLFCTALIFALGLTVWGQGSQILLGLRQFVTVGGTTSSGGITVTGSLGSYSTGSVQNDTGVRVVPGTSPSFGRVVKTGDLDGDSDVDFQDFLIFAAMFGAQVGEADYDSRADFDADGDVDFSDFLTFAVAFGQ